MPKQKMSFKAIITDSVEDLKKWRFIYRELKKVCVSKEEALEILKTIILSEQKHLEHGDFR